MEWIEKYRLVLLDFDGLLVNTEMLHYRAYQKMLEDRAYVFPWSFPRYCQAAHYEADALQKQIYAQFPDLEEAEPFWDKLYAEKKQAYTQLLQTGQVELMPGVAEFLNYLEEKEIPRAVVTHSAQKQVFMIRDSLAPLQSIPTWFTREDYDNPKPHPECYLMAIKKLASPSDPVIGFEDSPRGMNALMKTRAQAVIVNESHYPEIDDFRKLGAMHFRSFKEIVAKQSI